MNYKVVRKRLEVRKKVTQKISRKSKLISTYFPSLSSGDFFEDSATFCVILCYVSPTQHVSATAETIRKVNINFHNRGSKLYPT